MTALITDPSYRSPREDAAYFGSIWSLSTNQMAALEKAFEYHRDNNPSFGADYPEGALSTEQSTLHPLADREKSAAPAEPVEILARALCQIDGLAPDDLAPRQLVCGPYGEVLPNWEAYREKAEGLLAGNVVTDEMVEAFGKAFFGENFYIGSQGDKSAIRDGLTAALSTKKDA